MAARAITLLLILCSVAFGADSTVTVCPSGCDYTTATSALSDNQMDIEAVLGDDFDFTVDITDGFLETSGPSTTGYTTDNNNRGIVQTSGDARNTTGVWSNDYYVSRRDVGIDIRSDHFIIDGLQLECNSTGGGGQGIRSLNDSSVVKNCIIRMVTAGTGTYHGIQFSGGQGGFFYNNIIYDYDNTGSSGINAAGGDNNTFVYNNTISNCTIGMTVSALDVIARNNIIWGCPTVAVGELSTSIQSDFNATDSSTFGWANGGNNDSTDASFSFNDSGNDDWSLTAAFLGMDLSNDPNLSFSTDIIDTTRELWDVSAFEFILENVDAKYSSSNDQGTNWVNPGNANDGPDNSCATYDLGDQDILTLYNFGFSIPTDATIDSINLEIDGYGAESVAARRDIEIQPTKTGGGANTGVGDLIQNIRLIESPNCDSSEIIREAGNGLWNTTWTYTEINASTFGLNIADDDTQAHELGLDAIYVIVFYTEAGEAVLARRRLQIIRSD